VIVIEGEPGIGKTLRYRHRPHAPQGSNMFERFFTDPSFDFETRTLRRCFEVHVGLLDPPAIPIAIPYEDSDLPGYLFVPADDGVARPTVILNNGSDGPMTFLWPGLGQPGLDRGYNTVIFDGPRQQSMLFDRDVPFRPDWKQVITPLVDFLGDRPEVDASKIVLYGGQPSGILGAPSRGV
jgi:hypothetical protein